MRRSARAGPAALGVAGVNAIEKIAVALLWQAQEADLYQNLVSTGIEWCPESLMETGFQDCLAEKYRQKYRVFRLSLSRGVHQTAPA